MRKNIRKSLLVITMVMSVSMNVLASASELEDFSLHNGTKFGMTEDEVLMCEEGAGANIETSESGSPKFVDTVAGYEDTSIYYNYNDDKLLYCMCYSFSNEDYDQFDTIQNALEKKYGEPHHKKYDNTEAIQLGDGYTFMVTSKDYTAFWEKLGFSADTHNYAQWLLDYNEDSYILIDHYYGEIKESISRGAGFHELSYTEVSKDEYAEILKNKDLALDSDL